MQDCYLLLLPLFVELVVGKEEETEFRDLFAV